MQHYLDITARLDEAIRAHVTIDGVSIGTFDDKTTWTVCPSEQQSAAQPYIDAFVPNPRTQKWDGSAVVPKTAAETATFDEDAASDRAAERYTNDPLVHALADLHGLTPAALMALVDTKARELA